MRSNARSNNRLPAPWLKRHGFAFRLAGCFLQVALASAFVSFFNRGRDGIGADLIWVSNGTLLAYLLLAPRWRWPAYLWAGFAAQVAGGILIDGRLLLMSVDWTLLNLCEVLIAALLLRRRAGQLPDFTDGGYLLRFLGYGALAAPGITAAIYAVLAGVAGYNAPGPAFLNSFVNNALGAAVATPIFVAIFRPRFSVVPHWRRYWIYPAVLAAATIATFFHAGVPLIFLAYPLLVLILLHFGMAWSASALVLVAIASAYLTHRGTGPFTALASISFVDPSVLLQLFVAAGIFILYSVSIILERQRTLVSHLEKIAALHALVTENSRDAIVLTDLSGHRSYGTAGAQTIDGWKPEELMTEAGLEQVHPDDRPRAQAIVRELHSGAEGATIECRVRKQSGEYIWVEANLRVVRNRESGRPARILNIVRDISDRKNAELKLLEAYNTVEALSITDPLTGLSNRRRFDQYLAAEWRRASRDRQPLSLIMIDVDKFKAYNDNYGHQRGDNCLKQIAEACLDVVHRPGDLVARFGGEEFVIVLPNTENEGAMHIAVDICEDMRNRRLPHTGNPKGIVTVSAGCSTVIPKFGIHTHDLIEMADRALYYAKHCGRDQACNGNVVNPPGILAQGAEAAETVAAGTA